MKQPLIDATYLRKNALFFEPESAAEAIKLQQRLIAHGYVWRQDMQTVAFVQRCVADGITALPEGRMICGQPAGVKSIPARYEDFFALDEDNEASLKLLVRNLERSVAMIGKQADEATQSVHSLQNMPGDFNRLANRQQAIEDRQARIEAQLAELLELLRPRTLEIKKQRQP